MTSYILYVLQVAFTSILVSTTLSHSRVFQTFTMLFAPRQKVAFLGSVVTEYPMVFLVSKLFILYECRNVVPNNLVFYLDVAIMLRLWALFLQSVFARHPVYEQTKFYRNSTSTIPPVVFSASFWMRFHNPFWQPSRLLSRNENILYATVEEKEELKSDSLYLRLDVLQHSSFPRNSPVLIYIHSGLWTAGDKSERCPLLPHLALKHYVVVSINLRLAPKYNIVEQLIDVKRAIRWTRQNIESFGGDAKFIAIAGSSSGAHLATMAAMTQNHKEYQPNFETVDTSIQACVSIAGYYDATRNWGYKFDQFFNTNIVGLDQNTDLTRQFSPTWRLKEAEVSKSRVTATDDERLGPNLPPFLIIQFYNTNNSGKGDCLAPIRHVREFVKEFKVTCRSTCTIQCIELPNANHYFSIWSSPRSHILSYGIEPFLRHQFENFKKKE